jgi:hypothetical protein
MLSFEKKIHMKSIAMILLVLKERRMGRKGGQTTISRGFGRIQNSKFKIPNSRFQIQDSRFKIQDSRFKIQEPQFSTILNFKF